MDSNLRRVAEFHRAFRVPIRRRPALEKARVRLRLRLLREELKEVARAARSGDLVATLHELCDLQYVLDGAFLEFGLHRHKAAALAEIHHANMTKLGPDGRPFLRHDGKVIKGPNFKPADVCRVLRSIP
jgi:predicted HAD superfamily Cof-like phosphohydrolase